MKDPDPYLPGGLPGPLLLPTEALLEWWPTIREWAIEQRDRGGRRKLRELKPVLTRWERCVEKATTTQSFGPETAAGDPPELPAASEMQASVTVQEAAERLDVSPQRVTAMCRDGELDFDRPGHAYLIHATSLEAAIRRRQD